MYADGRVIRQGVNGGPIVERRLTPAGLDLVRSEIIPGTQQLRRDGRPWLWLPAGAFWADAEFKPYAASRYAVCYREAGRGLDVAPGRDSSTVITRTLDATSVMGRLPASARPLLRGKERTYSNWGLVVRDWLGSGPEAPVECSEVTAEEAGAVFEALNADPLLPGRGAAAMDVGGIDIYAQPILPHGEWVVFAS